MSGNPSGNAGNPPGRDAHLGDTRAPKWLVDANAHTYRFIIERQEREKKEQEEEAEEKRRKEAEAGVSNEKEKGEGAS